MKQLKIGPYEVPQIYLAFVAAVPLAVILGLVAALLTRGPDYVDIRPSFESAERPTNRALIPWNNLPYDPSLGPGNTGAGGGVRPAVVYRGLLVRAPTLKPEIPPEAIAVAEQRLARALQRDRQRSGGSSRGGAGSRAAQIFTGGSRRAPAYESGTRVVTRSSLAERLVAKTVPPELEKENYIPSTVDHLVVLRDLNGYPEGIWRAGPKSAEKLSTLCLSAIDQARTLRTTPTWLGEACGVEAVRDIQRRPVPGRVPGSLPGSSEQSDAGSGSGSGTGGSSALARTAQTSKPLIAADERGPGR
ncbi:MAG: hypothetical protein AAF220_00010 [Pseudomonadota bacterium]